MVNVAVRGSYFHIAMNGAASAEKIFKLLAAEEPADGDRVPGENTTLKLEHVTFGYEKEDVYKRQGQDHGKPYHDWLNSAQALFGSCSETGIVSL